MLPCYLVLDLETTGGHATQDRITEIAAVRVENGIEVARWSTLVNPGMPIPPFIQSLTGISDAMVRDAPPFEAVAPHLLGLLDGAVLVAHNVRFDHGFVRHELERLGHTLQTHTLCTVRLSRKLYPQHKGHGLDAITLRHGLHNQARHRAMGDVDVVLAFLHLAARERGLDTLRREAQALLQKGTSLPAWLQTPITDIPETPGVYLLYGTAAAPLYIGKSTNMRARVLAHFQSAGKVARDQRIAQDVRQVQWRETAGEVGALLLATRLRQELRPLYNRKPARSAESALVQDTLQPWPHPGQVGLREHHPATDRTDIHVFDQWCHVATVHDASALDEALRTRHHPTFDLDTYRLLAQRLAAPLDREAAVFHLKAPPHG